ncbi:hypothetical protein GCM10025875_27660 [Litorihabitans aurantiacus]|uniref:Htaa domain-containing protein n=1 Tax=Litorihabitans aurantiacus TaxID=1930061 RepID=A0AA37XGC5_9MICO|nr:hypothetical protein GCM10025875_27660 [Litorihabitans aurantiacus]
MGDTGGGRVWSEADGFYATTDGAVTIEKPYATDGGLTQRRAVPFADRCLDPTGSPVSSSSFVGTGIEAVIDGGTGTVDPDSGDVRIEWDGGVTVVFYGGLTYWWFSDPVLEISGGRGTLSATAGGYGTDMEDMSRWTALPATRVVLADLADVPATRTGFSTLPRYLGVGVTLPAGATPQVTGTPSAGSFPQSFVDFQAQTGQLAYWYSSGGLRDPAKPATTLYVSYDAADPVDSGEGSSGAVRPDGGAGGGLPSLTGPGGGAGAGIGADGDGAGTAGGGSSPSGTANGANRGRAAPAGPVAPTPVVAAADGVPLALPQVLPAETALPDRALIPGGAPAGVDPAERLALALTGVFGLGSLAVVGFPRGWFVLPWSRAT